MPRNKRAFRQAGTDIEEGVTDFVLPFETEDINATRQTGADWYRLMLAASLGGKAIHGLNPTPSCEMLAKVPEDFADRYMTGRIKFNPKTRKVPSLGASITDQHFTYKDFKGINSGTGAFFAFDQGMWEPSMRKRAREASLLAATLASHTNDKEGACEIVSKITSDEINEEAVDVACVPVSHLKRDVVTMSKRSHRVFSCGSLQRAITWDDTQLVSEKLPETAAVDWGRIIALARTIAEGNLQVDPQFGEYARIKGVPYALVKGCYAYVQYGDYVFDPKAFSEVPAVDLARYGIPTLKEAYRYAADSILKQCYVNLNRISYEEVTVEAQVMLNVIRDCRLKIRGAVPRRSTWTETDVLAGPGHHSIDAYGAARATATEATSKNAFADAYIKFVNTSPELIRLARRFTATQKEGKADNNALDTVNRSALRQEVWEAATRILTNWLGSEETAKARMASYKRTLFRSSVTLHTAFPLTANHLVYVRAMTCRLLPKAVISPGPDLAGMKNLYSLRGTQGSGIMQIAVKNMMIHFTDYRARWVQRYRDWIKAYNELDGYEARKAISEYEASVIALETITQSTALAINKRFIDSLVPRASYIYKVALNYVRSMGVTFIELDKQNYDDAIELAKELDAKINPLISFVHLESVCHTRLSWFAADFGVKEGETIAAEVDEDESVERFKELRDDVGPSTAKRPRLAANKTDQVMDISGVKVVLPKAIPSGLERLAAMLTSSGPVDLTASYATVRATYDSETAADEHAKANGYADFREAFDALGAKARFDLASEYTTNGLIAITEERPAYDDGTILA